jgi:hypothetical protein
MTQTLPSLYQKSLTFNKAKTHMKPNEDATVAVEISLEETSAEYAGGKKDEKR